jgi:hypothetical protein
MLPVLVAKLHRSVVAAESYGSSQKFRFTQASRQSHPASIFVEQAGFKAVRRNQINGLTSARNAL